MTKICKDCGASKPRTEFYKNKSMLDGRVNSCKDCTKIRVTRWRVKNIDSIREYDRNRPNKAERYRIAAARQKTDLHRPARIAIGNKMRYKPKPTTCQDCGASGKIEAHHADYTKPLDVEWLCTTCHGARHRKYDYSKL